MQYNLEGKNPLIEDGAYIAKGAVVVGNVTLEKNSSIWFNAVVRGDINSIFIGEGSNIQDNCTVHVSINENPVKIGKHVTVGHNAIVHGAEIGDNVLIGMGSVILDNAVIGSNTIIGANSLVTSGKVIPSGVLCIGSPAKVIRHLTEDEKRSIRKNAEDYIKEAEKYKSNLNL